jgi:hypothetical protein
MRLFSPSQENLAFASLIDLPITLGAACAHL